MSYCYSSIGIHFCRRWRHFVELYLFGVLLGVFLGRLFEFLWFVHQLLGHGFFERVVRLGRLHHAIHHGQTVLGVERWPPRSHHVHADVSRIELYRGMVNFGDELQGRCLEGVLSGKLEAENEFSTGVGRIVGALDRAIPLVEVLLHQGNVADVWKGFFFELCPLLLL